MPDVDREFLTPDQVAELLQLRVDTVYRMIKRGEIPAIKIRRVYRIERVELEKALAEMKTGGL